MCHLSSAAHPIALTLPDGHFLFHTRTEKRQGIYRVRERGFRSNVLKSSPLLDISLPPQKTKRKLTKQHEKGLKKVQFTLAEQNRGLRQAQRVVKVEKRTWYQTFLSVPLFLLLPCLFHVAAPSWSHSVRYSLQELQHSKNVKTHRGGISGNAAPA